MLRLDFCTKRRVDRSPIKSHFVTVHFARMDSPHALTPIIRLDAGHKLDHKYEVCVPCMQSVIAGAKYDMS